MCLSWTLNTFGAVGRGELEAAIAEAKSRNILMFCSANDSGPLDDESYPYATVQDVAFRIGAADEWGIIDPNVATQGRIHFILPGTKVGMENASSAKRSNEYRSGSPVATALAVGLAALILYCVQFQRARMLAEGQFENASKAEDAFEKLQNHEVMRKVFTSIGVVDKYIKVWHLFGTKMQNYDCDDKINRLSDVATKIIAWAT